MAMPERKTADQDPGRHAPPMPPPGGSPVEVRDAALRDPAPFGVYQRAGEPGSGLSAEDDVPVVTPHANPSNAPRGWTFGGSWMLALLAVLVLIALAALAL